MNANTGLNNFIGAKWIFIGLLAFAAGIGWLSSLFYQETFRAMVGLAIPEDPFDFWVIFSLVFLGGFCMAWGNAMLQRREWGALAGGLAHLLVFIHLAVLAVLFYQNSNVWLTASMAAYYNRWAWLAWSLFGLVMLWLAFTTAFMLLSQGRRDYYAAAYQDWPPARYPVCEQCGLIKVTLRPGRKGCPEHDLERRTAFLKIGETRKELPFTEDEASFIIGRYTEPPQAFIGISHSDTEHPERISAQHIAVEYDFEKSAFYVRDLDSKNKTYLRGTPDPLPPRQPYPLENGDKINLAQELDLVFESA